MLEVTNQDNQQIKQIQNSNKYIHFLDDILEAKEELSIFDMSEVLGNNFNFPNISMTKFYRTTVEDKDLEQYLVDSYIDNDFKTIAFSKDKKDLINHFKPYLIRNYENLNEYEEVTPHTNEYNILSYSIYNVLTDMFPKYKDSGDTFNVNSIVKSELVYKISTRLPSYIDYKQVMKFDYLFEENLRNTTLGHIDEEVRVVIDRVNDNIVFTISRFNSKNPVSIADILNYGMGYSFSEIMSDRYKKPLIVGLLDNESPLILDYVQPRNIAILGVTDKCPIAYSLVTNMVMMNHYEDLHFIICSHQDKTFWKMFSRNPHVLGYHTKVDEFKDIINDVYDVHVKRLKMAKSKKVKSFEELKPYLKKQYDRQLLLTIDGLSKILLNYRTIIKNASEVNYQKLYTMLNEIADNSHLTGISILAISERGDKANFPYKIIENSTMKIAMKESSENDINTLFGVDIVDLSRPIGLDYNIVEFRENDPRYCKTCSIGGVSNKQMLAITRVIAFDWVRKSMYNDVSIIEQPKGLKMNFAYNRNVTAGDSLAKIIDGKVIPSW